MQKSGEGSRIIERHFQSLVLALIVALVGWNLKTTVDTQIVVARQEEKIAGLTRLIKLITTDMDDRYRLTDAKRDFAAVYVSMGHLEKRVDRIEGRRSGDDE